MYADPSGYKRKNTIGCGTKAEGNTPDLLSRKGALREAKRDADIPYSQEPFDIRYELMRDRESAGGHVQKDANNKIIQTREYYYKNRKGDIIIIQDHSHGHEQGGQGAHFNVRPEGKRRNGHIGNTKDHYPFKK